MRKNKPENIRTTINVFRTTRDRFKTFKRNDDDFADDVLNRLMDLYERVQIAR